MLMYRGPRQSLGVALVAVPHFGVVETPFFCGIQDILPSPAFLPVLLFYLPTASHLHIASASGAGLRDMDSTPPLFFLLPPRPCIASHLASGRVALDRFDHGGGQRPAVKRLQWKQE